MKKIAAVSLLLLLATTVAFGHAGEVHSYMGTITSVNEDGSFQLKKTDGQAIDVLVGKATTYLHADGRAASAGDVKAGLRVVVKISTDGKTALSVKMAAAK